LSHIELTMRSPINRRQRPPVRPTIAVSLWPNRATAGSLLPVRPPPPTQKIGCPPRCGPPRMLPPTSVAAGSPDLASRRRQCHGLPCLHVGCQPMDRPANCLGLAKCVPSAQYLYYFPFGFSLNQFKLFKASEIIE
jgi:hypothetical protein